MNKAASSPALGTDEEGIGSEDSETDIGSPTSDATHRLNRSMAASDRLFRSTRSSDFQESKLLEVQDAFNKSVDIAPSYTMQARAKHGAFGKPSVQTEFGPDISKQVDRIRTAPPRWSLQPRPKTSLGGGTSWVPAPGHYPIKTTVEKTHPTIPLPGRGFHWGSANRSPPLQPSDTPDPTRYDVKDDFALAKDPTWTLAGRLHYDPDRGRKPVYNVVGFKRKGGLAHTPEWSFTKRPESAFVVRGSGDTPGPGEHRLPKNLGGKLKRSPSWGFGTSSRWVKDAPYEGPG